MEDTCDTRISQPPRGGECAIPVPDYALPSEATTTAAMQSCMQETEQDDAKEGKAAPFLELPRELRDMIYDEVILWERSRPTLGEKFMVYDRKSRFKKIYEPQSSLRGEYGCAYSLEETPTTCANFLCCNRQINKEMSEAIQRLGRKGLTAAKLDCIAEDESFHYFTWLGVPLVKTTFSLQERKNGFLSGYLPAWAESWMTRNLVCPLRLLSPALNASDYMACRSSSTRVSQLWIDIRLAGDRSAKWRRNSTPPDRTGWAVCAVLKRLFEKGPYLASEQNVPAINAIGVDELVLNVVPPQSPLSRPRRLLLRGSWTKISRLMGLKRDLCIRRRWRRNS
ncbi:hypothetical protein N0V90_009527 [Kalmusia sp. IMI 367209]|nr:hypothetical protein N0V90_009527 [Kalmusia sp. IMI 367209]